MGNLEEAPARLPGLVALARSLAASPWVSIEILADLGGGCGEAICCCICCIAWRSGSMVSSGRFGRPIRNVNKCFVYFFLNVNKLQIISRNFCYKNRKNIIHIFIILIFVLTKIS